MTRFVTWSKNAPVSAEVKQVGLRQVRAGAIALALASTIIPAMLGIGSAFALDDVVLPASNLQVDKVTRIAEVTQRPGVLSPQAVDPNAIYSDITNFTGQAFAQGAASGGITRLVADDVTFTTNAGVSNVTTVRFSVANLNATIQSVRPRIRFWNADGPSLGAGKPNAPGTLVAAFSFSAVSFGAASVSTVTGSLGTGFAVPAGATTTYWAGLTFDDVGSTTAVTDAQLSNFGQGVFAPVDLGSSTDNAFETTAAGSFNANSPAGGAFNFGGSPIADFGWEFVVTTLPVELSKFEVE